MTPPTSTSAGSHHCPIEFLQPRLAFHGPVGVAQIVERVAPHPLRGERRQHAAGAVDQRGAEHIGEEAAAILAGEVEADIAVAGDAGAEAQAAHDEPWRGKNQRERDQAADHRLELQRQIVDDEHAQHDQPADQDPHRLGMIVEAGAGEPGIAVEIALAAHFRPGRVDAQRDDRQKHVDDPDAEIFARRAGERELFPPHLQRSPGNAFGLWLIVHPRLSDNVGYAPIPAQLCRERGVRQAQASIIGCAGYCSLTVSR